MIRVCRGCAAFIGTNVKVSAFTEIDCEVCNQRVEQYKYIEEP